jgi:aspartate kinase
MGTDNTNKNNLKIFKFGGASVKNADAVRNVASILKRYENEKLIVVISAMGKTTNSLELIHQARFHKQNYKSELQKLKTYHFEIANELFGESSEHLNPLHNQFDALEEKLHDPCSPNFDLEYDQVVCFGELISTTILQSFLQSQNMSCAWMDARQIIRTDNRFRDARVNWIHSAASTEQIKHVLDKKDIIILQGFIGSTSSGLSTTLGREGSDFTAAIMAYLLDAASVTIWKDVPGMLNADPKWFDNTVKLDKISFREAIELAYYGASVIHPKTIKPLQNKNIPLYIKSFLDPTAEGSVIQENMDYDNLVPSYIFKSNQVLVSITPKDFSFIVEDNLREIFSILADLGIRISLMENSAISFSIVVDKDDFKLESFFEKLKENYQIRYNENLTLVTVRHWDEKTIAMLTQNKEILLEHKSRQTVRMVVR